MRRTRRRCADRARTLRRRTFRPRTFESVEPRMLLSADPTGATVAETALASTAAGTVFPCSTASDALIGLDRARTDYGLTGLGQTVVIIDTGVAYDHAALGGGFGTGYRVVGGYDFAENDDNPYDDAPGGGHGTHVAGILASSDATYPGMTPGVDVVALRVADDSGACSFAWINQALAWVHQHRTDFEFPITTVNISLGTDYNGVSPPSWATLEDNLAQLESDGIFTAVAAGNGYAKYNQAGLNYPAASPHVIPVASVEDNGALSGNSQRTTRVVAAPGCGVMSTVPDYDGNRNGKTDDFARYGGTSMAAPYVAGAAILLREAYAIADSPSVDQQTIYNLLVNTSDSVYDAATGQSYHRLNLDRAMQAIMPADEFGSTAAAAAALGTISDAQSVSGAIAQHGDQDWFTFVAGKSGTMTLSFTAGEELTAQWQRAANTANATIAADGALTLTVVAGQSYTIGLGTTAGLGRYQINLRLAATVTPNTNDWGAVSQREAAGLKVAGDGQWFTFTAAADGILTTQASFSGAAADVDLQLFNAAGQLVGGSYSTGDTERIDLTVIAGQSFRLHAYTYGAYANNSVGVRITNLVAVDGNTVRVRGTSGDDQFAFSNSGLTDTVTINSVAYQFNAAAVKTILFDGQGGTDTAALHGTAGNDLATLRPGSAELAGPGYDVRADGVATATVTGGGGYDTARMYDSAGDDTLVATPAYAELSGPGFDNRVEGFAALAAYAKEGGHDTARLYDSAGDDTFDANPVFSALYGQGFYNRVKFFDEVRAYATAGGADTAKFHDSTGDDTFTAAATYGILAGEGYSTRADYFDAVHAYAKAGGHDTAWLLTSPATQTRIDATTAVLSGAGFCDQAQLFEQVHTMADPGAETAAVDKVLATN